MDKDKFIIGEAEVITKQMDAPDQLVTIDKAVDGLVALHRRLLSCFQSPTGQPLPRRPKMFEPTMADCDAALDAAVALERAKIALRTPVSPQPPHKRPLHPEHIPGTGLNSDLGVTGLPKRLAGIGKATIQRE